MMTPEGKAALEKLAPFARRAKCAINGRGKLLLQQRRLAFVLLAEDLAENSRRQMLRTLACPVYQALTGDEIQRLFGLENTKILGFLNGGLASQLKKCFESCQAKEE